MLDPELSKNNELFSKAEHATTAACTVRYWNPYRRNTLYGFVVVQFPSGLIIQILPSIAEDDLQDERKRPRR
jgi:hypothetical protein